MKICVFSDVHGNIVTLQKMLSTEKNNIDQFIFLGDIFGYFCEQPAVIDTLIDIENLYSIKGNHERNYLLCLNDSSYKNQMVEKYGVSYEFIISEKQLAYIRRLPERHEIIIDGIKIGFFHGGPDDFLEQRVYPDTVLSEESCGQFDFIFLGHTHYQFSKQVGKTCVINPGSLGQPRDGKGFSYCIFDTQKEEFEFKQIEPDMDMLLDSVKAKEHESKNYFYLLKKYRGSDA